MFILGFSTIPNTSIFAESDDDNDGDGVRDKDDKCPTSFEDLNNYRDDDGCPDKDEKPASDILKMIPIIALIISFSGVAISIFTYNKTRATQAYADLDNLYNMGILKIGLDNPEFRNKAKTSKYLDPNIFSEDKRLKYETYAYMAMNICETAYDRTRDDMKNRNTWDNVIYAEKELHGEWFNAEENQHKFKTEFKDYVKNLAKPN